MSLFESTAEDVVANRKGGSQSSGGESQSAEPAGTLSLPDLSNDSLIKSATPQQGSEDTQVACLVGSHNQTPWLIATFGWEKRFHMVGFCMSCSSADVLLIRLSSCGNMKPSQNFMR